MVVFEKITAPASRRRAAGGASTVDGTSVTVAAPSGTGTPLVAILSLMVTGTPSSRPVGSSFCQRSVDAFATARAPSGSNAYSALMCGSHTAMCAITSSSTSDGENCLARKPAIRSTALRSCSDVTASSDAGSRMGAYRQAGFNDAREHAGSNRENFVVEHVTGIVHRHRSFMAYPEIGAGYRLHHVGEILAAHLRLRPQEDVRRVDHRARHFRNDLGLLFLVYQYAESVADIGDDLDLEGGGDAGADRAHPLTDQRPHLVGKCADGAAEFGLAGNHIVGGPGVNLGDRQHRRFQGIDVAADNGLQRLPERHRDHNGILRAFRHRAMRAIAVDGDVEEVGARHGGPRQNRDLAMVQIGRVVQPIDLIAGKFLEQAVLDHGAGAAEAFFGRLKDEMHGAVEIPGLREIARGAEQHGGVAVMAAAVEAAGNGRAPFQVGILFHRQRVHVGAQANALAAAAFALEHADHAGAAEAAMYLDAPLGQLVGHDAGGPDFLEADFGMGVQIPADRGEFLGIAFDAVDVGHVCYPVAEDDERDLVSGAKAAPFGLMRMPGRNRVHGNAAVSAGIAPGAAQMISCSAIGSKSARKCTELLLTRMDCSVGSMPT